MDNYGLTGNSTSIMIPRGRKDLAPLHIEIKEVASALSRVNELQHLTPLTYPEFVTLLNAALIQSGRLMSLIEIEYREAKNSLDVIESIVRLEKVEGYLTSKNIKSSADTRNAAVIIDPDVQEAIQRRDSLHALAEWAKHVHTSLERMYYTAKQVVELSTTEALIPKSAGEGWGVGGNNEK